MLSVWPARQGAGIGKFLLSAAVDHAKKNQCGSIRITVISVRPELIAWYERHGYRRTGEIEPFHAGEKFGIQKQPLQLVVLERLV
jgi:ribosomal protein S18 acetylase RimI-like enzyme